MTQPRKVLFVCRLNRNRSATAERLFCKRQDLEVRSAGTHEDARVRVNQRMVDWADVIFALDGIEDENLREMFPGHAALGRIVCLDIPDVYGFNDAELVQLLKERVDACLSDLESHKRSQNRGGSWP